MVEKHSKYPWPIWPLSILWCSSVEVFKTFATYTAWKVSKYGIISGPCFSVFGLNTEKCGPEITPYLDPFHGVGNYCTKYCLLLMIPLETWNLLFLTKVIFHGTHHLTLHKKWRFPLRISSVNLTKSAGNCGFGHINWRKL